MAGISPRGIQSKDNFFCLVAGRKKDYGFIAFFTPLYPDALLHLVILVLDKQEGCLFMILLRHLWCDSQLYLLILSTNFHFLFTILISLKYILFLPLLVLHFLCLGLWISLTTISFLHMLNVKFVLSNCGPWKWRMVEWKYKKGRDRNSSDDLYRESCIGIL